VKQELYSAKEVRYFHQLRHDIIAMIPSSMKHVRALEIGCGRGHTLTALQKKDIANETSGPSWSTFRVKAPSIHLLIDISLEISKRIVAILLLIILTSSYVLMYSSSYSNRSVEGDGFTAC
jgi:hypothetical protein